MFAFTCGVAAEDEPTTLEADDFTFDLDTGVRIYRGDVAFRQGDFHLDCDELATYHDADGGLDKGVCRGAPGRFAQRPDSSGDEVRGRARTITLDNRAKIVVLEREAEIEHGGNRIQGERITYDLASRKLRAGADGESRARMIVQPRPNEVEGE
ncbi:MAG: lipopolysaccharide transport periplasmic protein LptA [bacterium]